MRDPGSWAGRAALRRAPPRPVADDIAEIGNIYPGYCVERAIHNHLKAHIGNRADRTNPGRPTIRLALRTAGQIGGR